MYLIRFIRQNLAITLACICALAIIFIFAIVQLTTHRHRSFDQIIASGKLRVLYVQQFYKDKDISSTALAGEEYQQLLAFAKAHHLHIQFIPLNDFTQLRKALANPYADMAYDNISMTINRKKEFLFTNKVIEKDLYLVAHKWNATCDFSIPLPRKVSLESGTSYVERIGPVKQRYPELIIDEQNENTAYIIDLIANGELEMTICEKTYFEQYVEGKKPLKKVMDFRHKEHISWMLPKTSFQLRDALNTFLASEKKKKGGQK